MLSLPLLAAALALSAGMSNASPVFTRQATFANCLSDAGLAPITPSSSSYYEASAAFNQRLQPSPAALISPSTPSDISIAIKCASSAGIPVAAKSGGHSYASYGLGGVEEEALIIELSSFRTVSVADDEDRTAKVGAGMRLGDVAIALNEKGRGLPHGTCPYVGIGGHGSLGGFGFASRMWGLTVDTITAFDAVLANGTVVEKVTAESEPDLFWAVAGAAPSYALVTAFYFKTFPVPSSGIIFSYSYFDLTPATMTTAFLAYQSFGASSAPAELGIACIIGTGGNMEFSGAFYGSMEAYNTTMQGLLDALPAGWSENVEQMSWIQTLQNLAGSQALDTSGAAESHDSFFAKSLMTPKDSPLTEEALNAFFTYLADTETSTNWFVEANLYGGLNSAINSNKTLADNSFAHRDKLLTFQMYASSETYGNPYPELGVDFVQGMYGALLSPMLESWNTTSSFGAYINYIDPTLTEDRFRDLYWGSQYPRLSELRARYDPGQVFRHRQSIELAESVQA